MKFSKIYLVFCKIFKSQFHVFDICNFLIFFKLFIFLFFPTLNKHLRKIDDKSKNLFSFLLFCFDPFSNKKEEVHKVANQKNRTFATIFVLLFKFSSSCLNGIFLCCFVDKIFTSNSNSP